jgi:hypothetical protein
MTNPSPLLLALVLGLELAACNTRDIAPHQVAVESSQSDPGQGALLVLFTSTDATFAEEQAHFMAHPNLTQYHLLVDGQEAVFDNLGSPEPIVVLEGSEASAGYWAQGMHHFELAASGAPSAFSGDGPIVAGAVNRLYVLGPPEARQGRFTSYPFAPPAGSQHASVINLVQGGTSIEVVSCTDASHCTPVSPPLALGDTFEADFSLLPSDGEPVSLSSNGAGVGFRLVPTQAVPAPYISPLLLEVVAFGRSIPTFPGPPNFVGAPIYFGDQGNVIVQFN